MSLFEKLRTETRLPGFEGATGWLNSEPLTAAGLSGKVVLVDFWTYTCINWLRTLGYVRAWHEKYKDQGLVVVGVHTPEFPFEQDADNVRWAARDMRVEYPIALDPDFAVWRAFDNNYWPAVYIADAEGRIRHHQFGEGGYKECEMVIQRLLREAGRDGIADDFVSVADEGFEAQAAWSSLESPETYLGYRAGSELRVPRAGVRRASRLRLAGSAGAKPVGSLGELDNRTGSKRAERGRWADRVPLPRARRSPRDGAASPQEPRCRSVCSSTERLRPRLTGSTSTSRATERSSGSGSIS